MKKFTFVFAALSFTAASAMAANTPAAGTVMSTDEEKPVPTVDVQTEGQSLSLFAQLDENKDGLLTKEEAQRVENILAMFEVLDADQDGQLTLSEFEAIAKNDF